MEDKNLVRRGPLVTNNNPSGKRAYLQKREKARRQKKLEERVDRIESQLDELIDLLKGQSGH